MNALKDMNKKFIIIILIIMFSFLFVHIVQAVTAEPGSDEDPLVTKGYVDQKINGLLSKVDDLTILIDDLYKKIEGLTANDSDFAEKVTDLMVKEDELSTKVEEISGQVKSGDTQAGLKFEIIELAKGKQLVAGASTEIIVRAGTAKAIGSISGGLADFTAGKDIQSWAVIPLNHHLLVPRDDGRGLKTYTNVVILVKGEYSIK